MSVVSNLYAAKLYSEHPVAIWPLDDDVSYISLINDQQRRFESTSFPRDWTGVLYNDDPTPSASSIVTWQYWYDQNDELLIPNQWKDVYGGWTITNGIANDSLPLPNEASPFKSDIYAGIQGALPGDTFKWSQTLYNYDPNEDPFSIVDWGYVYDENGSLATPNNWGSIYSFAAPGTVIQATSGDMFLFSDCNQDLGSFCISMYVYQPSVYISSYEIGYEYYDSATDSWIEVTTTFDALDRPGWIHLQDTFLIEHYEESYCHIIFKATVNDGGIVGDYDFIINGITVGQWSENFVSKSLGANVIPSPSSASLSLDACLADQYGLLADYAYYLVEDGKLLASNQGVPLIYGSENVTRITPSSSGDPSLIFQNKSMFTEEGRYKDYTLEAWMRLRPVTKESKKIIGPIDNNDGVYVKEGFISLVIDKKFVSHNVSEWFRPMLVHVIFKEESAILLINGEQVGQISIDRETMTVSESDWIGIYSYSDFDVFEIDCVSIFSYPVPLQVARKRFVWGQGTDSVQIINDSFDSEEAVIEFSSAKYGTNYIYPDKERWDAGYYSNLVANTNFISVPEYQLPDVFLSGRSINEWYDDNKLLNDLEYPSNDHPLFFSFRPNIEEGAWEPVNGINWTEQSYLSFPTMSFLSAPISAMYGIFEVNEEISGSRPLIHIINTLNGKKFEVNIDGYNVSYVFDGQELSGTAFTATNEHFVVGFHIPTLSQAFNVELSSFFGNPQVLQVLIGGDGSTTFESKIYRIGFADSTNFAEIEDHFSSQTGIADYEDSALFEGHFSSYTLSPFFRYGTYFLDISVSAKWEEYFPLSSFASYITTRDGTRAYDLDYLQINYGSPSIIQSSSLVAGEYELDTTQSSVKAYVTFQLLAEGADEPLSSFTYTKNLTDSYTVYAESENTVENPYKAYKTKFAITDGTIIYPPKKIDFKDVAVVIHFNIEQDGIISNPLKIKDLEITSRSLNQNGFTPIGTKTGMPIYPYVKTGIYFSGKSKNPVMIGKDSLPYLYLTEKTGIRVLESDEDKEYGVIVPINSSESTTYSLGAVQMFIKYDNNYPVNSSQEIFNFSYPGGVVEFVISPDETSDRVYISARDKVSKETYSNIVFYLNGIEVENPYIANKQWNILSFSFPEPVSFENYSGSINLLYGCLFDNISFFKSSGLNEFSVIIPRNWAEILYNDDPEESLSSIVDWEYVYDENGILVTPNEWNNIYVLDETTQFSITPTEIYNTYVGTNIIVMDDSTGVSIAEDDFTMFADQTWLSVVQKPV